MYNHSNLSQTSTGSGRRISLNNPFRSALMAEEAKLGASNTGDDYKQWVENHKKLLEEEDDYDEDNFDFVQSAPPRPAGRKPELLTTKSDSSVMTEQKYKNNPFADVLSPAATGNVSASSGIRQQRTSGSSGRSSFEQPRRQSAPRTQPPTPQPEVFDEHYHDDHDLPPTYEETTQRYKSNEYPSDIKTPINDSSSSSNSSSRRNTPPNMEINNGHRDVHRSRSKRMPNLTTTMVTNVATGTTHARTRSRSEGEAGQHSSSRHSSSREHRHREHREHRQRSDKERHHSSSSGSKHRSSKSKPVEKPKNLDTIDKLDVTGFLGGSSFHHDGPFDACTPHRNKNAKAAPVMAFPVDGPNSSIKGSGPTHAREQQMDMMFGVSEHEPNSYTRQMQLKSKSPYSNGVVVKQASSSTSTLLDLKANPGIVSFDTNAKAVPIHGDTTLGLGSSTFLDGAPAYGVVEKKSSELTRKKSLADRLKKKDDDTSGLIKRVKSLRVSRNKS